VKAWWVILLVVIGWGLAFWAGDCYGKKYGVTGTRDTVSVEVPVPPFSHAIDSLEAVIEIKEQRVTAAQRQSGKWQTRVAQLEQMISEMKDTSAGTVHAVVAKLDTTFIDPKAVDDTRYSHVEPDTMRVEYDVAMGMWKKAMMSWGKRLISADVPVELPPAPPPEVRYSVPWYYFAASALAIIVAVFAGRGMQ
jgi:hypothetical protein